MPNVPVFLLVEDGSDDATLVRRTLVEAKILNPVFVLTTAEAAVEYFKGEGRYNDRREYPLPSVVFLDLALPGMGGFEFLKWLRQQPQFGRVRVVVLTASTSVNDMNQAYRLGANSFLVKGVDFERFVQISRALAGYWMWSDKPSLSQAEPVQK